MKFKIKLNIAIIIAPCHIRCCPPATSGTNDWFPTKGSNTAKVWCRSVSKSKPNKNKMKEIKSDSNSSYNDFHILYLDQSHGNGVKVTYANEKSQYYVMQKTKDGRIGNIQFTNMSLESGIPVDHGSPRSSSASCILNNTRTLTSADSPGPHRPDLRRSHGGNPPRCRVPRTRQANPASVLQQPRRHLAEQKATPTSHKGDQINFYVDDGPYRLEADMFAGHVEIESMPSSYVIEYGNGDTLSTTPRQTGHHLPS